MSPSILVLTLVLLALPLVIAWQSSRAPEPIAWVLRGTCAFMLLLYASIWFYSRPSAFIVGSEALEIVWPLRRQRFTLSDVEGVERVTLAGVRAEFGRGMRVGAGGLWGAFGRYVTPTATVRMYISRLDELVLIRLGGAPPWLVSPEHPGAFVQALQHAAARYRST
jgi:hypothetical protein